MKDPIYENFHYENKNQNMMIEEETPDTPRITPLELLEIPSPLILPASETYEGIIQDINRRKEDIGSTLASSSRRRPLSQSSQLLESDDNSFFSNMNTPIGKTRTRRDISKLNKPKMGVYSCMQLNSKDLKKYQLVKCR